MKKFFYILLFFLPAFVNAQPDDIPNNKPEPIKDPNADKGWHPLSDKVFNQDPSYNADFEFGFFHASPYGKMAQHTLPLGGISMSVLNRLGDSPISIGLLCEYGFHNQDYEGYPAVPVKHVYYNPNLSASILASMTNFGLHSKIYLCNPDRCWIKPFIDCAFGFTIFTTKAYFFRAYPNPPPLTGFNPANLKASVYAGTGLNIGFPLNDYLGFSINPSLGILYGGAMRYTNTENMTRGYKSNLDFMQWKINLCFFANFN